MGNDTHPARPTQAGIERKLAAILSADVQGFSRLMGADEEATLHILQAYREVTDALIQHHRGRFVGSAGDSVLAEFASVVDAVQCAVAIQCELKLRNAELPEHRRMEFRIGINLGDVMVDGEQIYGDGVNIAARLQALAHAGGICISGTVHEHVKNKLTLNYEDLGEQVVKNIAEPVRVWRVRLEESGSPVSGVRSPESKGDSRKSRRVGTAHSRLSLVYVEKQQYDQAMAGGERAMALDPNNADSYVFQAHVLNSAGRPEEALRRVEQAMRLNPHYPPLYLFQLGWAYSATGRYAEAVATLKEALSRSPNQLGSRLLLASSYLRQWDSQQSPDTQTLAQALATAEQAIVLNDASPEGHAILGSVYLWQKQYDQALAEMKRAVALAPTKAWSYAALAVVLSHMGRSEDALEADAQALRLKPEVTDGHLADVGIAYAVAGRYEEARAPLQRFLSRYPNILHIHLMLAAVYSELGKEAEARAEAAEVLRINPQFSLAVHRQRMPIKDPAVLERHLAALRKAGLK